MDIDINNYIDNCISLKDNHYDIAFISYQLLKNKYKYEGGNKWNYYDNNKKEWIEDINMKQIKNDIKSVVVGKYLERIKTLNNNTNDQDKDLKIMRLLQIANKLKNEKFIVDLIKELKQFYNNNDNDNNN
jgi:aspartyl/asparaginyl-tRNA synthetase